MKKIVAFILAAGQGERLSPITNHIPKPLLPVLGKPAIEIILEKVLALPLKQVGINMHYKCEMISKWIQTSPCSGKIKTFQEKKILGTGGALKNAEKFFGKSVFLVHNSDILSDINLEKLIEKHLSSGKLVSLAIHDYQKFNNVWIDKKGDLKFIGKTAPDNFKKLRKTAFTGIAVYSPEFLKFLPQGNSNVVDAWLKVVLSGREVGTVEFTGCKWSDIGTPEAYSSIVFDKLKEAGEAVYIHPSVNCGKAKVGDFSIIEKGCIFKGSAQTENCIILPESVIKDGSKLKNMIVGPTYLINLNKSVVHPQIILNNFKPNVLSSHVFSDFLDSPSQKTYISLIGTGGSDRKYYRITKNKKTAVLMECPEKDPDFQRHITYTKFFKKYAVPVPELFDEDAGNMLALFEDLGDISLFSWLKCRREPKQTEEMYKRVLDILINLHTLATKKSFECHLLQNRIFDYDHLRWESNYFIERFACGLKDIKIHKQNQIYKEFDSLAKKVDSFRKAVIHRDFQSQNIMISKHDMLRLVDYQGARMGPPAYDVASILWDPYYRLEDNMRERLLEYYIRKVKKIPPRPPLAKGGWGDLMIEKEIKIYGKFNEKDFRDSLFLCRLQRHLQALGAYGFLSKVKGKTYFLKHIPQALQYLKEETELAKTEYPELHKLVKKIYEKT